MKKLLRIVWFLIKWTLMFLLVYFASAFLMMIIPVNHDFTESPDGIPVYLISNGMHVEIAIPHEHRSVDWGHYLDLEQYQTKLNDIELLCFGWGDRDFYLDVPSWDSLDYGIVGAAAFLPTEAIMHVSLLDERPEESRLDKVVMVNEGQFKKIEKYLLSSFKTSEKGCELLATHDVYPNRDDHFYAAHGKYSLFNTCNTWVNNALIQGSVKTSTWTPSDKGVLVHFK